MRKFITFAVTALVVLANASLQAVIVHAPTSAVARGYGIATELEPAAEGTVNAAITLTALESGRRIVTSHARLIQDVPAVFALPTLPGLEVRAVIRSEGAGRLQLHVQAYRLGVLEAEQKTSLPWPVRAEAP